MGVEDKDHSNSAGLCKPLLWSDAKCSCGPRGPVSGHSVTRILSNPRSSAKPAVTLATRWILVSYFHHQCPTYFCPHRCCLLPWNYHAACSRTTSLTMPCASSTQIISQRPSAKWHCVRLYTLGDHQLQHRGKYWSNDFWELCSCSIAGSTIHLCWRTCGSSDLDQGLELSSSKVQKINITKVSVVFFVI